MTTDALQTLALMALVLILAWLILWASGLWEGDYTINLKAPAGGYIVSESREE